MESCQRTEGEPVHVARREPKLLRIGAAAHELGLLSDAGLRQAVWPHNVGQVGMMVVL